MFRIEKRLVLPVDQPADIPLIPVPLPGSSAFEASVALEEKVADATDATIEAAGATSHSEAMLEEARQKAQQTINQAKQDALLQAQQITQQAEQQAEAIRADAWQAGYEDGRHEGRQEALLAAEQEQKEHNRAAQEQLQVLLNHITTAREELFAAAEGEIIDLALAVAGKITQHIIAQDSSALTAMIQQALRQMRRQGKITIQVSEEQYNTFFQEQSVNFALGGDTPDITIIGNPQLNAGDLLLEATDESVNAGADSQLKYITLAFGRPWEPSL